MTSFKELELQVIRWAESRMIIPNSSMTATLTDAENMDGYESGPFCRHFSDPHDCEVACKKCGHACHLHGAGVDDDEPCRLDGCDCEGWVE